MSETILPCPFCGFECFSTRDEMRLRCVICESTDCAYRSGREASSDEVIAAHNRIASAVADRDRLAAENERLRAHVAQLREALKAWQILHSRFRPVSAAYPMVAEEVAHLLDYTAATLAATAPTTGEEPAR